MATDLQRRKHTRMFQAFDADHSGYLEFADLEAQINNVAQLTGLAPSSPQYQAMLSGYRAAWERIRQLADTDRDERVVLDEWLAYCSQLVDAPDRFERELGSIATGNVKLLDRDGDGSVSHEEFGAMRGSLDTDDAAFFQRFDPNGDGYLSGDELVKLFREFFLSDDPDAPGNLWYGPF